MAWVLGQSRAGLSESNFLFIFGTLRKWECFDSMEIAQYGLAVQTDGIKEWSSYSNISHRNIFIMNVFLTEIFFILFIFAAVKCFMYCIIKLGFWKVDNSASILHHNLVIFRDAKRFDFYRIRFPKMLLRYLKKKNKIKYCLVLLSFIKPVANTYIVSAVF